MILESLMSGVSPAPYQAWNIGLLIAAYALCLLIACRDAFFCRLWRKSALPPVLLRSTSNFPNRWDIAYTFAFLAVFAFTCLIQAMTDSPESTNDFSDSSELTSGFSAASMLGQLVLFLPMLVRYATLPCNQRRFSFGAEACYALATLFIAILLNTIYSGTLFDLIVESSGCPRFQYALYLVHNADGASLLWLILTVVVIAPICEECCFRGFLYNVLRRRAGKLIAAAATALLFGAVHMSLAQMLPLTIYGFLLCLLYEKTHSLRAPILAHALFNLLGTIGALYFLPDA